MPSYSSTVTILELAADGSTYRKAVLAGPGLPLMGAEWGIENRLVTEWYPGNQDEATQQSLGRKEMPSAWRGEWNRTRMGRMPSSTVDEDGNASAVHDPLVLYNFLEAMFSTGRALSVTWNTEQQPGSSAADAGVVAFSGSISRTGRCKTFKGAWRTIFDCEWSVEFEWSGRGKNTPKVASTRDATVAGNGAAYAAALDAIVQANQYAALAQSNPSALTLGQLEQLASTPSTIAAGLSRQMLQLENDLAGIVAVASTAASQPVQVQRAAVDHARNAKAIAESSYKLLSGLGVETLTTQDDAVAVVLAHEQFALQEQAQLDAAAAAFSFQLAMRRSVPDHAPPLTGELGPQASGDATTVLATYVVRQGDTAGKISQRYYGTPDHAADLLAANGLSWHSQILPAGKIIYIPRISSAALST